MKTIHVISVSQDVTTVNKSSVMTVIYTVICVAINSVMAVWMNTSRMSTLTPTILTAEQLQRVRDVVALSALEINTIRDTIYDFATDDANSTDEYMTDYCSLNELRFRSFYNQVRSVRASQYFDDNTDSYIVEDISDDTIRCMSIHSPFICNPLGIQVAEEEEEDDRPGLLGSEEETFYN